MEWFRPGEHARVEAVLADLTALGVRDLRTNISWADWNCPGGEEWYAWLLPRLGKAVNLLPCLCYTPPSLGVVWKTSSPPREPRAYADWMDVLITRFGEHFEWVELWNEPNNLREWDETVDPGWYVFSEMVGAAAYWAKQRGKRTLLGGMSPIDPNWLRVMFDRGVMQYIDAVGIHGFPITFEFWWEGWEANVRRVMDVLRERCPAVPVWITETGYSTFRNDERRQLASLVEALAAPVERLYWYSVQDLDPSLPTVDGFHSDEREYYFGLRSANGAPKLLHRIWAEEGLDAVRDAAWLAQPAATLPPLDPITYRVLSPGPGGPSTEHGLRPADRWDASGRIARPRPAAPRRGARAAGPARGDRPVLITGGAGFVGTNLAHRLLSEGRMVVLYDNLSRPGVERNLNWLRETHGDRVQIELADVRDAYMLRRAVQGADQVFHFAAQVAVTTSLSNPVGDFEINARGTLNLLEAIRGCENPPSLVFTSTNKVYGGLPDVPLRLRSNRYEPVDPTCRARGIGEERALDFHSPYGCSKGAADQYVLDYARTFGLPAVVFRMSCIYGPHQFGTEDQGWVAHFLIRAIRDEPITLYGDGKQVRDILFAEDLVDAFLLAQANSRRLAGSAFNLGGGPANTISLLELLDLIEQLRGRRPDVRFDAWRPGDQRYYVSDTRRFEEATGWRPRTGARDGVAALHDWLRSARGSRPDLGWREPGARRTAAARRLSPCAPGTALEGEGAVAS